MWTLDLTMSADGLLLSPPYQRATEATTQICHFAYSCHVFAQPISSCRAICSRPSDLFILVLTRDGLEAAIKQREGPGQTSFEQTHRWTSVGVSDRICLPRQSPAGDTTDLSLFGYFSMMRWTFCICFALLKKTRLRIKDDSKRIIVLLLFLHSCRLCLIIFRARFGTEIEPVSIPHARESGDEFWSILIEGSARRVLSSLQHYSSHLEPIASSAMIQ